MHEKPHKIPWTRLESELDTYNLKELIEFLEELHSKGKFEDELEQILKRIKQYISDDYFYYTDFQSSIRKIELVNKILDKYEDLYHCIINGYYSFDLISYTRNLLYFFDFIYDMVEFLYECASVGTSEKDEYCSTIEELMDLFEYYLTDMSFHHLFDFYSIEIGDNKLKLNFKKLNEKEYEGFTLNIKKVQKDKTLESYWFQNHLKKYCVDGIDLLKEI